MLPQTTIITTALLFLATLTTADKATVNTYVGPGCAFPLENFIGTCEGNCYKPVANGGVFDSIWGVGGTGEVRCHAYSDDNCQTEIQDTGDIGGDGKCTETKGTKSVKCFSGC